MTDTALTEMGEKPSLSRIETEKWKATPLHSMWLRGLIPKKAWPVSPPLWSYPWIEGSWEAPKFTGKVCTDGSGGKYSSDNELRRCGWGAVQLDPGAAAKDWKWVAAPLAGSQQTVPRAEITSVLVVAENTAGNVEVWTDRQNIVNTVDNREWATP